MTLSQAIHTIETAAQLLGVSEPEIKIAASSLGFEPPYTDSQLNQLQNALYDAIGEEPALDATEPENAPHPSPLATTNGINPSLTQAVGARVPGGLVAVVSSFCDQLESVMTIMVRDEMQSRLNRIQDNAAAGLVLTPPKH